ncbi:hypothetical protein D3C84_584380 [compost metagenome]
MLGGQQRTAQAGNQHAGVDDLFKILGKPRQLRRQGQLSGDRKKQQLQGNPGRQDCGHHRGQRQGAAAQATFRHSMNTQPGQPSFSHPATEKPERQGHDEQQAGQQAFARLPRGSQCGADLLDECVEFLPIFLRRIE